MNHEAFIGMQSNSELIINGRGGFWLKIVSESTEGYIFSPYGTPYK
jgi:hypothetical protein